MLPQGFLDRVKVQLGTEYDAFLQSLERPRAVALRFRPKEQRALPFLGELVPWEKLGYYYDPEARPGLHPFHEAGVYYLQEASAMAPVALLDPQPGERGLRSVRRSRREKHADRRTAQWPGLPACQ